jgi:two-component system chemotaxis response regulator CheB
MLNRKIVIAAPDAAQRNRLASLVETMPEFAVIARTADLMNTYNEVEERIPKAVLISDVLAKLPEFEVMRALFSSLDVRWLVVTAPASNRPTSECAAEPAPRSDLFSIPFDAPIDVFANQLHALTRTARQRPPSARTADPVYVGRQAGSSSRRSVAEAAPGPGKLSVGTIRHDRANHIILIGASTGGIDALLSVLSRFPQNCPPTLIVQHTGSGFGQSLAGLLDRQSLPEIRLADGSTALQPGRVVIGAGINAHLVIDSHGTLRATTRSDAPVSGHTPSVDVLFHSAVPIAKQVSAALLTGMGRDGADGMRALHAAGAVTIAQDEASCVVFGMPRAAIEAGAVHKVLPIDRIGDALLADHIATSTSGRELYQ